MKKLSKKTNFLFIAVFSLAIVTMLSCTPYLFNKYVDGQRKAANLTIKSIDIPGFKIAYAEGGAGDTIIMVHGYAGNKDNWYILQNTLRPTTG